MRTRRSSWSAAPDATAGRRSPACARRYQDCRQCRAGTRHHFDRRHSNLRHGRRSSCRARARAAVIYAPPAGVRDAVVECARPASARGRGRRVRAHPRHDVRARHGARARHVGGRSQFAGFRDPGTNPARSIPAEYHNARPVALFGGGGTLTATTARLLPGQRIGQSLVAQSAATRLRPADEICGSLRPTPRPSSSSIWARSAAPNTRCSISSARSANRSSSWWSAPRAARRRMGHAGALIEGERGAAQAKLAALREAGAHVVDDVLAVPHRVKQLLDGSSRRCA